MTEQRKRILVPTSGYLPAKERGDAIIDIAKRLSADILVVHIRDPKYITATVKETQGWEALRLFEEKGRNSGVHVTAFFTSGPLVETLKRFVEENKVDLILIGASPGRLVAEWITHDLLKECDVPILIVPQDLSDLL